LPACAAPPHGYSRISSWLRLGSPRRKRWSSYPRIIGYGGGEPIHRKQKLPNSNVEVESYKDAERYIVVTGNPLPNTWPHVADIGWVVDDDGGYSGGSTDRPDLQRLLDDIRAGKIDVIVVYKVDRLTRSLADFAKRVELFDAHSVSFVSVTQQFNTTTTTGAASGSTVERRRGRRMRRVIIRRPPGWLPAQNGPRNAQDYPAPNVNIRGCLSGFEGNFRCTFRQRTALTW
jgi:hypothetical protein